MKYSRRRRAQEINWAKARLTSANDAITNAEQVLKKYKIVTTTVKHNLINAKDVLKACIQNWDKEVWRK